MGRVENTHNGQPLCNWINYSSLIYYSLPFPIFSPVTPLSILVASRWFGRLDLPHLTLRIVLMIILMVTRQIPWHGMTSQTSKSSPSPLPILDKRCHRIPDKKKEASNVTAHIPDSTPTQSSRSGAAKVDITHIRRSGLGQ